MNDVTDPGIAAARSDVLARIAAAAKSADRDPASVALVAVSKTQPDDRIDAMVHAFTELMLGGASNSDPLKALAALAG